MSSFDAKAYLTTVPNRSGIYQMFDKQGALLYVGKARELKKRLSSYFNASNISVKTQMMVAQINHIEITITANENEALLLENALIKEKQPRYNVIFRDDKSYPYLYLSRTDNFPRLTFYRGKSKQHKGDYFGPYPSVQAARSALNLLQKAFKIRQCEDAFFKSRSRPCLQYHIKRCTAPCVGYINTEDYADIIKQAKLFLAGKDDQVIELSRQQMRQAADAKQFEKAALCRDRINLLMQIQQTQSIYTSAGDNDIIALIKLQGRYCIDVLTVRGGQVLGHKAFFPRVQLDDDDATVLSSFISQYYINHQEVHQIPQHIIVNFSLTDRDCLSDTLTSIAERRVQIVTAPRGLRARWLQMALENAEIALNSRIQLSDENILRMQALQKCLHLDTSPTRLECFDISHLSGEKTVASCVVFNAQGPARAEYRRFNIADITPGDDYAAIKQAVMRHFRRIKSGEGSIPDVLFIDGGKGQLRAAEAALLECQVTNLTVIAISKGKARKRGDETLWRLHHSTPIKLPINHPVLHLIQHIRDEAHRFALTGSRNKRKVRATSEILHLPGIGAKRHQALLQHFGGREGILQATAVQLAQVPGINKKLAALIYQALHQG